MSKDLENDPVLEVAEIFVQNVIKWGKTSGGLSPDKLKMGANMEWLPEAFLKNLAHSPHFSFAALLICSIIASAAL